MILFYTLNYYLHVCRFTNNGKKIICLTYGNIYITII